METGKKGGRKKTGKELEERCGAIGRNRGRDVDGKVSLAPQWEACATAML